MKLSIVVLSLMLAACSATKLKNDGAKLVRITHNEPAKECKFLGDITGNQGNWFTGAYTSNSNLETGARNDLKNKAANMGGNVVYILTNRAGQTGSYGRYGGGSRQTNVTLTGSVFNCPGQGSVAAK